MQDEFNGFLDLIAPSLKVRCQNSIFTEALKHNKVMIRIIGNTDLVNIKTKNGKATAMLAALRKNVGSSLIKNN